MKQDKDKYDMILLIYRICKNDTNEVTYKTENNKPTALKKTYGYQRGKGEEGQIVISYSHIYKTIYKIDNHIYVLVYCNGLYLSGLLHSV